MGGGAVRRGDQIGVIVARATLEAYPELLPELVAELQRRSLSVVLGMIKHEGDVSAALEAMCARDLAGIIAAAPPGEAAIEQARRAGIALLLYNCAAALSPLDTVSCDHAACGRALARVLLEGGHRRFGIIAAPEDSLVGTERVRGAIELLRRERALAIEVERGDYGYESGAGALASLLARLRPRPSAVIAANDLMAMGALDHARACQIRVPRDLSIVGIDGTLAAQLPAYRMTTVRQPLRRMTRAAVDALVARLAEPGRDAESRLFAGEMIIGASARLEPRRT